MTAHPLNGAFERAIRAAEHLEEIERLIETFRAAHEDICIADFDPEAPDQFRLSIPPIILPARLSVLVGETCYNGRAALDYLIYALSILDCGGNVPKDKTQFPVKFRKDDFARQCEPGHFIGCLSARHAAMIEGLQPYKGCEWTKALINISNPDKHRHLIGIAHEGVGTATIAAGPTGLERMISSGLRPKLSAHKTDGLEMHVHFNFALTVALPDGTPVVETLKVIQSQISETLDAFKPEFER